MEGISGGASFSGGCSAGGGNVSFSSRSGGGQNTSVNKFSGDSTGSAMRRAHMNQEKWLNNSQGGGGSSVATMAHEPGGNISFGSSNSGQNLNVMA